MIHFVFPQDALEPRRVDEHFAPQQLAFRAAGFSTSVVPDATFEKGEVPRGLPTGAVVAYRGWMVDERQYRNFSAAVRAGGAEPLTPPEAYLLAHHLPNWYDKLREFTPETVLYPVNVDLEAELRSLGWPAFFIKDHVKSLKTSKGSLITDPADGPRLIEDMERFRGVIEGGICVRRVEPFRADTEVRYFVISGTPHAPTTPDVPSIVRDVASRIDSQFFSVDVAETDVGELRVVEIGDGQVSDLVGWSVDQFVRLWPQTA